MRCLVLPPGILAVLHTIWSGATLLPTILPSPTDLSTISHTLSNPGTVEPNAGLRGITEVEDNQHELAAEQIKQ